MYFPLSNSELLRGYVNDIFEWTSNAAMFSEHNPTQTTSCTPHPPLRSASPFCEGFSAQHHPLHQHCGRKRPQGKRHWFLFLLRSISRFAGQFSSRLPRPRPRPLSFSLYRHFKFSIARIFSILQAMNFLITPRFNPLAKNASDNFRVNIYEKRPN